jgi:hypothetical protein
MGRRGPYRTSEPAYLAYPLGVRFGKRPAYAIL